MKDRNLIMFTSLHKSFECMQITTLPGFESGKAVKKKNGGEALFFLPSVFW